MNTYLAEYTTRWCWAPATAGCEAALACACMGLEDPLPFTMNLDSVALMACNPAIGGTSGGTLCGSWMRWGRDGAAA